MAKPPGARPGRDALGNHALVRSTVAYQTNVLAEWALFVAALVYAQERQGAAAAGFSSIALLVPNLLIAPVAGAIVEHHRPDRVRQSAYIAQVAAYGVAAIAAATSAPVALVIGPCALGVAAGTFVRPACAVLLPAIVRSSRELTVANLWVGHCESLAVLGGPIVATVLLAVEGPALALAGCAVLVGISVLIGSLHTDEVVPLVADPGGDSLGRPRPLSVMRSSVRTLAARPGARAVLAVAGGQYVLVGGLDLLFVVLAGDALDLGEEGAGILAVMFGAGALLSVLVATALVRRQRLAPTVVASLLMIAVTALLLGSATTLAIALVLLPLLGCSRSLLDLTSRMLLQRSAPPSALGAVFAVLELLAAAGMIIGSLVVQVLIALAGVEVALVGLGAFFVLLFVTTWRPLRVADDGADVPVVAISLLRRIPLFAPLPPLELEAVARSATELGVDAGEVVIGEGQAGDHFYAVAEGRFDVSMAGQRLRSAVRGDGFGEIALLADVPRTATVTAACAGQLLAIERTAFLLAVTHSDAAHRAAWTLARSRTLLDGELPEALPTRPNDVQSRQPPGGLAPRGEASVAPERPPEGR